MDYYTRRQKSVQTIHQMIKDKESEERIILTIASQTGFGSKFVKEQIRQYNELNQKK